jgi:hypothetical protein
MSVNIIADQITWRSQGVECIEMAKQEEAKHTINSLREIDLRGRMLLMNEARPLEEKRPFKPHSPHTDSGGYPHPIISPQARFTDAYRNVTQGLDFVMLRPSWSLRLPK